ncbi:MAG: helix-turn-helix transcriptional regulator [Phycisphaerales bacterium]|nr:helix-turn-helix transcriptional regulator [Phycisphaerales bacterium]
MPSTQSQSEHMDEVFKALADPTRRAILDHLKDGRKTTTQLVQEFPQMTRFGVMKHLNILEGAQLVVSKKEGRTRWNHLNAVPLRLIYERWVSGYENQWAGSLIKLKHAVESKHTSTNSQKKGDPQ